jgi:hypothetical protein
MRRVLAILKYVPAVLCGLLVMAWVMSYFVPFGLIIPSLSGGGTTAVFVGRGTVCVHSGLRPLEKLGMHIGDDTSEFFAMVGSLLRFRVDHRSPIVVAMPFVLTILALPCALCLTRFPLWSYFAWTALVAAELAYYLR